jgi:hypothetical protein
MVAANRLALWPQTGATASAVLGHRLVRMRTACHPVSGESLPGTSAASGDGPGDAHQGASLRTAASMPGGT